jgi:hypothetical protein
MQGMIQHQLIEGNIYDLDNVQVIVDENKLFFVDNIYQQYYSLYIGRTTSLRRVVEPISFFELPKHTSIHNIIRRSDVSTLVGKQHCLFFVIKFIFIICDSIINFNILSHRYRGKYFNWRCYAFAEQYIL